MLKHAIVINEASRVRQGHEKKDGKRGLQQQYEQPGSKQKNCDTEYTWCPPPRNHDMIYLMATNANAGFCFNVRWLLGEVLRENGTSTGLTW